MQVTCVKAFGTAVPGDTAEVPDGASVDPEHWVPSAAAPEAPEAVSPAEAALAEAQAAADALVAKAAAAAVPVKEM